MKTHFEKFSDELFDVIFQETCEYMSDVIGTKEWGEEKHDLHGEILYRVVEKIYKDMTKNKYSIQDK